MELGLISHCGAFTLAKGSRVECTHCGEQVMNLNDDDDIVISMTYNRDPEILKTIEASSASYQFAKRFSTDRTCALVDNVTCHKCKSKCRYVYVMNKAFFVCSNGKCREVIE